jgi:hypothetical protein
MRRFRPPSARVTNAQLFVALLITFATGAGAEATGSARGAWVLIGHGVAAAAVILLIPWKTRVVRAGLRRHRYARWASLTLAVLVVVTLLLGLGYTTGVFRSVGGVATMWLHVAVALALVPLLLWHSITRWATPRRTDVSRRNLLRVAVIGGGATTAYLALAGIVTLLGLPGARRRFTGSYETASFQPRDLPNVIWLDDTTPTVDPGEWRLTVVDGQGQRQLSLGELPRTTWRATLDCTSGWYSDQDWSGVPMSALIRDTTGGRSVYVHSITGYWVRLPLADLDHLLLATQVGGETLSPGHGFPLRLVAPQRRGYWWVKWVDRIEVDPKPWWWQSPFPLT